MIYGIGTDICDVRRIAASLERHGERFAEKVLADGEPVIVLHGALREWFEAKGLTAHLSVTDETDYAASFCVVEKIQAK